MLESLPVVAICGHSGSGKTGVIERLLPRLRARGLSVAVVKHAPHGTDSGPGGKDSHRLFRAGADVLLQGPRQVLFQAHRSGYGPLASALESLAHRYDLVLLESFKSLPLPKVWLLGPATKRPPSKVKGILEILPQTRQRVSRIMSILEEWLERQWLKIPTMGCVLIGGQSARMGRPKHLIARRGTTWLEQTVELLERVTQQVVIVGRGSVPRTFANHVRLHDVPEAKGPMAGILAAMRWAPHASWLVAACDLPDLSREALDWLLSTRVPGVWAVMPRLKDRSKPEPLLAYYDFRCRPLIESLAASGNFRMRDIIASGKVISPTPPSRLAPAWRNANTPSEAREYLKPRTTMPIPTGDRGPRLE